MFRRRHTAHSILFFYAAGGGMRAFDLRTDGVGGGKLRCLAYTRYG